MSSCLAAARRTACSPKPNLDFLVSVARQTTIAIESARLYLETQRRAQEMSALAEVGRELSASLDPAVVLDKVVQRAKELLAAETSAVFLMQPDQQTMRTATAVGKLAEVLRSDVIQMGEGIIGSLARDGRPEFRERYIPRPRGVQNSGYAGERHCGASDGHSAVARRPGDRHDGGLAQCRIRSRKATSTS